MQSVLRLVVALLLLTGGPAAAQEVLAVPPLTPEQKSAADAAMFRLKSPYTASHTVDMCPSAGALRDSIRVAAAGGMSADALVEDVIARHGEHLRILPKRSGAGLLAWLATPLVLLTGVFLVGRRIGLLGGREEDAGAPPPAAVSEADRSRLAAAMQRLDADEEEEL